MTRNERQSQLEQLAATVAGLSESPLYAYRIENEYRPVMGEGDIEANIMFVGEAPGEKEAQQGRPFVGAAGKVLSELLASIDLSREAVYITNIVKDRPPKNRDPRKGEIALYAPFLAQQIEIIQPKVIAPLGRFSMEFILDQFGVYRGQKISQVHGMVIGAKAGYGPLAIVPLYHPAASFYNRSLQAALREDIQVLKRFVV